MAKRKKRRTTEQICADIRKERVGLYRKRTKALKSLNKSGLSDKQKKKVQRSYDRADKRIRDIKSYLFKCTKKYDKLRNQKKKLQRRKSYLTSILGEDISKTKRNKTLKEIRKVVESSNQLDVAMQKGIFMVRGEIEFVDQAPGVVDQVIPAWIITEEVKNLILSNRFDVVIINGVRYRAKPFDMLEITAVLEQVLVNVIKKQDKTQTPMIGLYFDERKREIRVDEMLN